MKINKFPATISVKVNKDDPSEHFLSADTDTTGAAFAMEGEKVKIAIYKLDHVREVTVSVESRPIKSR